MKSGSNSRASSSTIDCYDFVFRCLFRKLSNTLICELQDNETETSPSGRRPFDVKGGHPRNSHDCMPNELINHRLKENARKAFENLRKRRRNMKSLQSNVENEASSTLSSSELALVICQRS